MNYHITPLISLVAVVYGGGAYNQNVYSSTSSPHTDGSQSTSPTTPSGSHDSPQTTGAGTSTQSPIENGTSTPGASNTTNNGSLSTSGQTLQPTTSDVKAMPVYTPYIIGGTLLAFIVFLIALVRILRRRRHNGFPGSMQS